MRLVRALLLAACPLILSDHALAMTCGLADVTVRPRPLDPAPRNTLVWLFYDASRWQQHCDSAGCSKQEFSHEIRLAPVTGSKVSEPRLQVPAVARVTSSGDQILVRLRPKALLPENRRFEVWEVPRDPRLPPRVVGTFRTTAAIDEEPPMWSGVQATRHAGAVVGRRGKIVVLDRLAAYPEEVFAGRARDASGPALYAVWRADVSGAWSARDPDSFVLERQVPRSWPPLQIPPLLDLGSAEDCDTANFHEPASWQILKLVIRPVDVAGNLGPASEATVRWGESWMRD